MSEIKENIIKEAKRIEEDSEYSSIGHFKAVERWSHVQLYMGILTSFLSAFTGYITLTENFNFFTTAGIIAILVSALSAIYTFLNPNEKVNLHHKSGTQYNTLRNAARIFIEIDCLKDVPIDDLDERLKQLVNLRDEYNKSCPHIPQWAYEAAKKSIEKGETKYKVDS